MTKYFVWLPGLRGPEAQLWDIPDKTVEGKPIKTLTKPVVVNSNERTLDELKKDYPYVQ